MKNSENNFVFSLLILPSDFNLQGFNFISCFTSLIFQEKKREIVYLIAESKNEKQANDGNFLDGLP